MYMSFHVDRSHSTPARAPREYGARLHTCYGIHNRRIYVYNHNIDFFSYVYRSPKCISSRTTRTWRMTTRALQYTVLPPRLRRTSRALLQARRLCLVAVCCSVLQCVAVCCSVLQQICGARVVPCYKREGCVLLQRVAVCCNALQRVAMCGGVLQCVAACCNALQCVAARLQRASRVLLQARRLWVVAVCCSVLQCVAARLWRTGRALLQARRLCLVEVC